MRKLKLLVLLALICLKIQAQTSYYKTYNWEKAPTVFIPTEDMKKNGELLIVFEKKFFEIAYDADGTLAIYETIHILYHVNSEKAIDNVNKGYMSLSNINEEIDLRARCISPQNKITNLNKASVKKVDDLEGAGPYKLFAIDGVEVGSDVEIIYTNKKQYYTYFYDHVQLKTPILLYEAMIISPKNLIYETKSYNNLNQFKSDTLENGKNRLHLVHKNIDGFNIEKYSPGKSTSMGYIAQLTYNMDKKKSRFYTWDIISRDYYNVYYTLDKAQLKPITKSVDKLKLDKITSLEEKIKTLDSYIKTTFEVSDANKELSLEKSIESKKMTTATCLAYYINAYKYLQIPFELVLTTERDNLKFDPKFPSHVYVKEYLLYFPDINKYVSPFNICSRVGFPTPSCVNNEGLFIKEVNIGEIYSSSAKAKNIEPTPFNDSYHNYNVTAQLDFNEKTTKINVSQYLFGYSAFYIQPIYRYLNTEQKSEIHKNYYLTENSESVKNFQISNVEEKDLFNKPMIVKYDVEQNDFLENAGNKYIFKVGLLIGTQAELYQENKRLTPADMSYAHLLKRELEINIPEGFKATNLNDLILNKTCSIDGKEAAVFKSSFEVKQNKILITIYEDYKLTEFPLSSFNDFKNVINAAADFNKKNIVFEKI
ncbi:MAG: hypothetical protein H0W61_05285 [Bacteroidetes bacterium]|nr:hypothetical protein [Bacteroidota bacterium]